MTLLGQVHKLHERIRGEPLQARRTTDQDFSGFMVRIGDPFWGKYSVMALTHDNSFALAKCRTAPS